MTLPVEVPPFNDSPFERTSGHFTKRSRTQDLFHFKQIISLHSDLLHQTL